ncbi:phosphomannomutase/phosphoglucomutase [bacterium]|nr:phosphomannomutase/phosphoglucomutase [bacterium]
MNPHIFRQYDIRGVAETDLTEEVVMMIGRAFASWVRDKGGSKVLLGRDGRLSGKRLNEQFKNGIFSAGADVIDLGVIPTPLLYFAQYNIEADAAVQITGSHNPAEFNGFKMLIMKETLYGDLIQELRQRIEAGKIRTGDGMEQKIDITPHYFNYLNEHINIPTPLKIGVDSGNGVGGLVAPKLLAELGCEVTELFSEVDGNFPNHHPDPTVAENIEELRKTVLEKGLDFGVAFDGDADRIGVIDDKGQIQWGDRLLALFARDVLENFPGASIIGEVKCSKALYDDIAKHGGNPIMWKTGHSLLKAKLRETNAKLAGEMSGHMFFNDRYYGFDDAIYAAARLAEIVSKSGKKLSELLSDLPMYPSTPEMRVDCPDDIKFEVVEKVAATLKAKYDVVDIDGVRVNFDHGWGLVRASNTQPVLVLRFEADSEERMQSYRSEVEGIVAKVRESM